MTIEIRREEEKDYHQVEELTRKAFYNVYMPGCTEHYLVHIMRSHKDFVPELALVLEDTENGRIIGNVMYTKARLVDENSGEKTILTFGPLSILPEYQRKGYGKRLLEASFEKARELGYEAIVIFVAPANYVGSGFLSCKRYRVSPEGGSYPAAMLVKELKEGALGGRAWTYYDSPVMNFDEEAAKRFDDRLEPMEKKVLPSQEEFYILSHSVIQEG